MAVQGWLAQASQQLLVPEQRTLEMRENLRATPCSWRLSFQPTVSLERDLLHQAGFFPPPRFFYQLWLVSLLLFKSTFPGILTRTTRFCKL